MQEGRLRQLDDLREYIRGMLEHSWAPADAMGVQAAYLCVPAGDWERLWRIDRRLHAQRAPRETREAMRKMGRRLLATCRAIHPALNWGPLDEAVAAGRTPGTHSVVHGTAGALLGVPLDMAAEGFLYTCMVTAVNSALRLMSLGQTRGQALLAELLPLAEEAWGRVKGREPEELAAFSPVADIAMMRHEALYSRLFMS